MLMADDPIRAYIDAQKRRTDVTESIQGTVSNRRTIADHLRDWRTVVIGGCGDSRGNGCAPLI